MTRELREQRRQQCKEPEVNDNELEQWLADQLEQHRHLLLAHFEAASQGEGAVTMINEMSLGNLQETCALVCGTSTNVGDRSWLQRRLFEALGIGPAQVPPDPAPLDGPESLGAAALAAPVKVEDDAQQVSQQPISGSAACAPASRPPEPPAGQRSAGKSSLTAGGASIGDGQGCEEERHGSHPRASADLDTTDAAHPAMAKRQRPGRQLQDELSGPGAATPALQVEAEPDVQQHGPNNFGGAAPAAHRRHGNNAPQDKPEARPAAWGAPRVKAETTDALQAPIKAVSPTGGGTAAAGGPSHGAAPSKGSKDEHKIVKCQADGCKADLSILKNWRRERHICKEHFEAAEFQRQGVLVRYCCNCHKAHPLDAFDGDHVTCRKVLAKARERSRRRRLSHAAAAAAQEEELQTAAAAAAATHGSPEADVPREEELQTADAAAAAAQDLLEADAPRDKLPSLEAAASADSATLNSLIAHMPKWKDIPELRDWPRLDDSLWPEDAPGMHDGNQRPLQPRATAPSPALWDETAAAAVAAAQVKARADAPTRSLKVVANPESDTKSLGANVAAVAAAGLGVKCLADLRESELDSDAKREADRMPELLNQFASPARAEVRLHQRGEAPRVGAFATAYARAVLRNSGVLEPDSPLPARGLVVLPARSLMKQLLAGHQISGQQLATPAAEHWVCGGGGVTNGRPCGCGQPFKESDIVYVAVDRGSAHYYFKHLTPPLEATVECGVGEQQRRAILERVPQAANNQKVFDFTDVLGWSLLTCAQQVEMLRALGASNEPFISPRQSQRHHKQKESEEEEEEEGWTTGQEEELQTAAVAAAAAHGLPDADAVHEYKLQTAAAAAAATASPIKTEAEAPQSAGPGRTARPAKRQRLAQQPQGETVAVTPAAPQVKTEMDAPQQPAVLQVASQQL